MFKLPDKTIIYQLLVRHFGNKNTTNKLFGTIHENGCGRFNDITEVALQSLKELGITHLWFTGVIAHATTTDYRIYNMPRNHAAIVKGRAGSPYAISDYYDVDPDLAENVPDRMTEFEQLIERTHQARLSVIIDFVPNHVSREYHGNSRPAGTINLGENDNPSLAYHPGNNFYYLPGEPFRTPENAIPAAMEPLPHECWEVYTEKPARVTGNDCFSATPAKEDWFETVKLNYGVDYLNGGTTHFDPIPPTWQRMREILIFWAGKGVDGFRCDMAGMVPAAFWAWVIPVVKRSYPSLIFIAEIYEPELYQRYLDQGQFDYLYDKVGLYDILCDILAGRRPASDISLSWQNLRGLDDRMLRFIENHDEQRIASRQCTGDPTLALPAMVAAATLNMGPVMIYSGQEVGEPAEGASGYSDDDGKTSIYDYCGVPQHQKWLNNGLFDGGLLGEEQKNLRQFYANLFRVCQAHVPIAKGSFYDLMWVNTQNLDPQYIYTYVRYTQKERLLIVLNFGDQSYHDLRVHIPLHTFDLMQQFPDDNPVIHLETAFSAKEVLWKEQVVRFTMKQAIDHGVPVSIQPHSALIFCF